MKKRLYIKTAFLTLASAALLSSCLKDNSHYVDFAGSKPLVEFPAATGIVSGSNLVVAALDIQATPTAIPVMLNVAAPKPLTSALTVTVAVDPAALAAYNTANKTSFVLLPPADYTIPSLKITIPANQNSANLTINVNTSAVDPTQQYILPLTIVDGGGQQISNYKTVLYNIQAKNKYDGVYSDNAYVLRAGDPVLTGNFSNVSVPMATAGGASVGFNQIWGDGKTIVAGVNPIILAVDPTTNKVTVSSGVNATLVGDPSYNNHYDPASKTFYVSFYWNAGKTSRDATDTLKYVGPR